MLDPAEKTILHIPNVNSRESTKENIREVEHIIDELGKWQGADPKTPSVFAGRAISGDKRAKTDQARFLG